MKEKLFWTFICLIAITSCNRYDVDYHADYAKESYEREVAENVEKYFGTIDPNQDWSSIKSGFITVTANADLANITKIQILTESPFLNPNAKLLCEAEATNGQTVTIAYEAPKMYDKLFVACVNKDGLYYTKCFNTTDQQISFQTNITRAARRAGESTYNFPPISSLTLDFKDSYLSYNAIRSIRADQGENSTNSISPWKGKGWDNERLWCVTSNSNSGGWAVENHSIRRSLSEPLTEEERSNLQGIFEPYLYFDSGNTKKDNLSIIRKCAMVKLYNNQLEADGEPVVISPVQNTSADLSVSNIFYYYYNPSEIQNMSNEEQVQFIKNLPKYMAICGKDAQLLANGSTDFYRKHEYLLPYYGDRPQLETNKLDRYKSDGNIYMIRNGYEAKGTYYMVYNDNENYRLAEKYQDEDKLLPMQLWQIFKTEDNSSCYLYNVGARCFLYYSGSWNTTFTPTEYVDANCKPYILDITNNTYQFKRNQTQKLGSDLSKKDNKGIWSDKQLTDGTCDWYLEKYQGSRSFTPIKGIEEITSFTTNKNFAYAIPKGYKVGFMLRKYFKDGDKNDCYNHYYKNTYTFTNHGEVFADGRLNTEINQFPDFKSALDKKYSWGGSMLINDPRCAIFNANNKTYITFEDGVDCNYVDVIIEVRNGIKYQGEEMEIQGAPYTMCFEDRPNQADYDMNDVVLRCRRINETKLELTLVATGANDDVVIHGATGSDLDNREVHDLFKATEPDEHGNRFVNTVNGGCQRNVITSNVVVDKSMSIPDYLKGIYIENKTTGKSICISGAGVPPFVFIVPEDFRYPMENTPITDAYKKFIEWAQDANNSIDWYRFEESDKIFPSLFDN